MLINICLIVLGLAFLIYGAEFLVKGAVGISVKAKLSRLVIGMTVVSFGTSTPELIVSVQSAMEGLPEITIGNIIGSNITNLAVVLGITVLIFPVPVARNTIKYDWPVLMLASILFYVMAYNLYIHRWEGLILFLLLVVYTSFIIIKSRKNQMVGLDEIPGVKEMTRKVSIWKHLFFLIIGLVGLYFGSNWLIEGAKSLALEIGLSNHVIGITVVAFGTSVPELVTSVVAAYRKETDISVGNLIGSNIFNIFGVLGLTAIVNPIGVENIVLTWDALWMIGITLILFPMLIFKRRIGRLSGFILTSTYIIYVISLF